jgi:uncharacterized coiled-coil protein SlyX
VETIARATAALRRLRATDSATPSEPRRSDRIDDLEKRVAHLEAALEGLQDAVYRQDVVHDRQIADLRKHNTTVRDPPEWSAEGS